MPTFQYEAMDNTGLEVKDTIDAASEQDAQTKIREKGFFVTKISEKKAARRTRPRPSPRHRPSGKKRGRGGFSIGGVRPKQLCTFTRQLSTLQDAGLPILRSPADSRRPGQARTAQERR